MGQAENLTKAERIRKYGEVFTPTEIVERMLDMLEQEDPGCFAPEKTFLEPTCGEGVFVIGILRRKFANCRTDAERRTAIRSFWAMELQADNVEKTIRAVTEYCERELRLTKTDREAIRDHVIQADSLKVMKMMYELNEREPKFVEKTKLSFPVPREVLEQGGEAAADTIRRLFYQSMEAAAKEDAEAMAQELINGTAKMFGVPAGLVLDEAKKQDARAGGLKYPVAPKAGGCRDPWRDWREDYKTDCFFYTEDKDMGATIPWCSKQGLPEPKCMICGSYCSRKTARELVEKYLKEGPK